MSVQCPHCFRTVVASPEGDCPSCGRSVTDLRATDPDRATVEIAAGDRLPDVCCICGVYTDRRLAVRRSGHPPMRADKQQDSGGARGCLLNLFGGLLFGPVWTLLVELPRQRRSRKTTVKARVPVCPFCEADGRVEPLWIDFEQRRMYFAVHRRFAERLAESNGRE
jgi:hypothetical protein